MRGRITRTRVLGSALLALPLFAVSAQGAPPAPRADTPERIDAPDLPGATPINHLQVLGTHNSYALPVDRRLVELMRPRFEAMLAAFDALPEERRALMAEEHPNGISFDDALNYLHPDLTTQLDLGMRSLELDVNPDPDGGRYADPAGYRALRREGIAPGFAIDEAALARPGYKVQHIVDYDFRSHCTLFVTCLAQIRDWSDAHQGHVPLFILVEAKSQGRKLFADSAEPLPFDKAAFDALDAEILSVFDRSRIITPDDLRGEHATLNAAARAGNWPRLERARGKVMFLMITANGPQGAAAYLEGHPSLAGRVAFLRANPGEDHAAFLMYDNAIVREDEIRKAVAEGYLVRTRSDIETYEARANDMTRANAALGSGAQIVSTDFERPGNVYGTPYLVRLPTGEGAAARLSPAAGGQ
ncbi:Ca2+-dependent phosphoinositide-specific phospholipase C [Novosphingobium decolorationis]|uniref:Calcium-dependent phosphoinositide phospholipase C n=1 Tax=Novosphingobium decolorationis TaxID=2698673 RepID=A0ABX8E748_9SPHN|nr:Ca2+-dependent phosphoinositide-specific phospholipase C [Novosphingobium decolorationis]QVM84775.1 hypothetical protein HT578_14750 [Novosphingobium decolorationis]